MERTLWWTAAVPISLVTDRDLPPTSRAMYMVLLSVCNPTSGACSLGTQALMEKMGFGSHHTVRAHLRHLENCGWLTVSNRRRHTRTITPYIHVRLPNASAEPAIKVPGSLLNLRSLPLSARWLYTFIMTHDKYGDKPLKLRQPELLELSGLGSRMTLRTLILQLQEAGWLRIEKHHGKDGGSTYMPLDPHFMFRRSMAEQIEHRLQQATFKGEALMKELLNILIEDNNFQDNARPGFLVNPLSQERLELDRWYPDAKVAVEFNGPQHYTTTKTYSDPEQVSKQRSRDLIKAALATENLTKLVTIRPTELTPETLARKLAAHLPMRELHREDPVLGYLYAYSRNYVRKAQKGRFND